jgi:pimeloyl-ACP methyl ester carboxylesterase
MSPAPVVAQGGPTLRDASLPLYGDADVAPDAAASPAVGGAMADAGPAVVVPPPTALVWKPCEVSFECSSMSAPLDYADPQGPSISIALMRRRAASPKKGALLLNPGGPGASAIAFLLGFVGQAPAELKANFDLVAFDPRGVGKSTAVDCHSTLQSLYALDPAPNSDEGWRALTLANKTFGDECKRKAGTLLEHVGTLDAARDMDRVRAALGEEKLTYLGFSYGTRLGAHYADLFPERVRALVLDGAAPVGLSALDIGLQQAQGFELALSHYFAWCSADTRRCKWAGKDAPAAALARLREAVRSRPVRAPSADRPLGAGELAVALSFPMYLGEDGWVYLSAGLDALVAGDGSKLMTLADMYLDRKDDGSYGTMTEAFNAVMCSDQTVPDALGLRAESARFASAAPTFGLYALTGLLACSEWPVAGHDLSIPRGMGAPPILVVGTTGDPATPYAWAQTMANTLASGKLLTHEGEGHTAYAGGNSCVDAAVNRYLIDLVLPTGTCSDGLPQKSVRSVANSPDALADDALPAFPVARVRR